MRKLYLIAVFGLVAAWAHVGYAQQDATGTVAAAESADVVDEGAQQEIHRIPLIERLKQTGKVGYALLAVSILSLTFALERLFNLRQNRIVPSGLADEARELWAAAKFAELEQACDRRPSTLARIIRALLAHRGVPMADASLFAGEMASREMKLHLQRAYPMAVAATIAPLLGLFGTVYGMIGAFEAVALAGKMGDPSIMAEDISFALMTTAVGLIIAVPSLAAYHLARIYTNVVALKLEEQSNELILEWFLRRGAGRED
jgi:biopolymer transport protein ExbB